MMENNIYLCVSNEDFAAEQRLRDNLLPILPQIGLTLWGRGDLKAGQTWKREMEQHLKQSRFFVVLATSKCIADVICYKEIQAAQYLTQHGDLKIISIRVESFMFELSDLVRYPSLPKDGKPISAHSKPDQIWTEVLRDLIQQISATHRYIAS